jgi:hypothetical protein
MAKLTYYNIAASMAICLGGFTYGFGFAVFVTVLGQPGFYDYFELDRGELSLSTTGLHLLTLSRL